MKLMGFPIAETPEVVKHKSKSNTTYQLRFHSEEYPGFIFILQDEGFRKINGHEFAKDIMVGEKIEFFVDKNQYERNYEKSKNYDYFSSHLKYKNHLTIYGILYQGNHVLYANNYKKEKENNFHSLSIAFIVFGIGLLLAIHFGNKYEYLD